MLGFVLLPLVLALFMSGEKLEDVRDFLMEYSPLNGLASLYPHPHGGRRPERHRVAAAGHPRRCHRRGARRLAYALLEKRDV